MHFFCFWKQQTSDVDLLLNVKASDLRNSLSSSEKFKHICKGIDKSVNQQFIDQTIMIKDALPEKTKMAQQLQKVRPLYIII